LAQDNTAPPLLGAASPIGARGACTYVPQRGHVEEDLKSRWPWEDFPRAGYAYVHCEK